MTELKEKFGERVQWRSLIGSLFILVISWIHWLYSNMV